VNFIKNFSSLNVNEAFKTLFPTVNEEGRIVFNSSSPEKNQEEILNVFRRHINLSQTALQAEATPESLADRRQWLGLIQQLENMSNTSPLCKELLNTVQNVVLGRICDPEGMAAPINISYKEIENSEYLKKALFGDWHTSNEGVIRIDLDQVHEIREYLENRENLRNITDLAELIYYYKSASFLVDNRGQEEILSLIKTQIDRLSLEDLCQLFPSVPFDNIRHLLEVRIIALAPKGPPEDILTFFKRVSEVLGDSSHEIGFLSFYSSDISSEIFGQIVDIFPNIHSISLTDCGLNDKNLPDFIFHLQKMKELQSLEMPLNNIGPVGAQSLACLINLQELDISENHIADEGVRALALLVNLKNLNISSNEISPIGAEALIGLINLEILDISFNNIGPLGAEALACLVNIETLYISNNQIGDLGAKALARLVNLKMLDVSCNRISDEGAEALAALIGLKTLYITENKIQDAGARSLASLANLEFLNISDNKIGDLGAEMLVTLTNLKNFCISNNQITDVKAREFAALVESRSLT